MMSFSNIYKKLSHNLLLSMVLLFAASCVLGVFSLSFAAGTDAASTNAAEMYHSYFQNNWIVYLNILPCIWLCFTLWFATQCAALSFILTALPVMGLTIASWFKLLFRNDPLMCEDIFLIKEAGNMSSRYDIYLSPDMMEAILILFLIAFALALIARGKLPERIRVGGTLALLVCLVPMRGLYTDEILYSMKTDNSEQINPWSTTQTYLSKGFLYPFLHSIQSAVDMPPLGYHAQQAANILAEYTDADIPEHQKVDIIGVMLEAYADFSVYDQIEFEADPYEEYHKLEQEGISGNLLTNIFAGGTIDTERCFLTGYCNLGSFRSPTNSYARYFAEQGYTVTGSHPSYKWFYNRENINANLGFTDYKFLDNHYNRLTDSDTAAMDRILFPELIRLHEQAKKENDKPYFSFSVTYQGHGPYGAEENFYNTNYVKPGVYKPSSENILNNYFGSIADTDLHLKEFFDHYRASEDPVIIVMFGDHKPWLGDNSTVYAELGIDLAIDESEEGFRNYYGTRYLIWANDAAKQALGKDFQGKGRDIGPYFLMDALFRECGWQGPAYMQAVRKCSDTVPVMSVCGLYMQNGELVSTLTEENAHLVSQFRQLEYYERKNFHGTLSANP